ncbi:helix-turn-helix domain-containing protein [Thomasclavelia ramosa]|uniref:helix-turn-helix domain-containing protein n=1 Tax=Thomasclavelia ramosa TaxID=1547 RepID=UPI001D08414B|nr:helix-turn-helix domain-containing protein [Thomasclavelia ramosa]MCB6436562.1 helix-turn-helix domain-containing protein [Thomasclavelia ramosa]MCB6459545.1 helix-turn-helix domain-containing protein [Thomasclavelia ramosa]MCB6598863.1 helix-turn-helix domain-containing protein [Thomasclavelia ramosa]MCB6601394.1 helix-turn-helix domain-containing protein [Thomasclavelia ramosa]MCB6620629.1 helix-turn-helix domain-containing protein [Thomasclavelia ramosa]
MAIIRMNKSSDYTVMSNTHLKEKNMSLKAKGLLSLMLSLRDDWEYSVEGLVSICKESEVAVKSALNELKKFNYLKVTKLLPNQTETGRIEYIYDIFEKPQQDIEKQGVENLGVEILDVEIQALENQGQLNTKELNTKELNTKELNTKDIYNAPSNEIATEPPVIEFILNDKTYYPITQKQVDKWSELYPNVDIMQHLRKMCGWLDANPRNRKTKGGILKFVNGWLAREQDKPRKVQQQTTKDLAPAMDFNEFY